MDQKIKGYESNYPRKTVSSFFLLIVMPGFFISLFCFPEDEPTNGGGG
jgi:hypothetical protein